MHVNNHIAQDSVARTRLIGDISTIEPIPKTRKTEG